MIAVYITLHSLLNTVTNYRHFIAALINCKGRLLCPKFTIIAITTAKTETDLSRRW